MFKRLSALLAKKSAEPELSTAHWSGEEFQLAAAALLVEAALSDGGYGKEEREGVARVLAERFELTPQDATKLLESGEAAQAEAVELFRFTHALKQALDSKGRIGLIEMLWEVVYADRRLDAIEDRLVRRVAGLLHVTDQERGAARRRVRKRLGLPV